MYDRTGRRIEFNQTSQNFEKVKLIQNEDDAKWIDTGGREFAN